MIFNSLISRVIILSIMLMTTGIGIFTLFHIQREEQHLIDATRESAKLLLSTVEKSIFTSMSIGNSEDVQSILEQIGETNEFAHLRIFHPDGTILKSSFPSEIGTQVSNDELALFTDQKDYGIYQVGGEGVLGMVRPIESDQRCFFCHGEGRKIIGVLNLNFSLQDMTRRIRDTSEFFFGSTIVIVLLLSLGISFILIRFVKRPMCPPRASDSPFVTADRFTAACIPTAHGDASERYSPMLTCHSRNQAPHDYCSGG